MKKLDCRKCRPNMPMRIHIIYLSHHLPTNRYSTSAQVSQELMAQMGWNSPTN